MNEELSMSEAGATEVAAGGLAPSAGAPSAGSMLRQMREAAGVDPTLLASAMKVSVAKLEALENDRLDQLPDITFARGLAAAICRAFGVDPAPVLERMPVSAPGLRPQHGNVNQPFRRSGDRPASMLSSSFSKPLLIAVAGLLIAAAALWLLPTLPIQLGGTEPESTPVAADGTVQESVTPVAEPVPAEPPVAAAAEPPAPAPVVPEPVEPPASTEVLSFAATGETWVTVRDAAGKPLINRALAKGEVIALNGELPLSVTIGRKDAVTVKVKGEPFDIKSMGRGTVARFQVQ
jgi:cytoskeleton protein RodZ